MAVFMQLNSHAQKSKNQNIGLDNPVNYSATDSIVADIPNQIIRLYGKANVTYDDVILNSEVIEIDLNKNEISAYYGIDSLGNKFGNPEFTQAGELIKCDRIKYNFDTKKGYITEVRAQQGEGYIHMAESKIHPNQEIHLKNGKYTSYKVGLTIVEY
jgi:lipopolysaccharide assembly outer membrane protein LptD (OstA)